jgi:hypothetical protein
MVKLPRYGDSFSSTSPFWMVKPPFSMVKLQIVEAPAVFFSEPYQASSTGTTCCAEGSWGRPGDTHGALTKLVIFDQN